MLPSQKAHMEKTLVELIRNTTCNVELLSLLQQNGVLSKIDCDDVQSFKTSFEKSRRLYEILPTRDGSFDVLQSALKQLKQTGAHRILQQTEQNSKIQDFGLISVNKSQMLGQGRSGTKVYRGIFDGRDVAVKVIKEEPEEALNEVNFLKKLDSHPNIIRYYMAEHKGYQVYIALELCVINLEDEMSMKVVKPKHSNVLKSCTEGLAFLHMKRILHRDLKPANILLNWHKEVKISDFGFSKQLQAENSTTSATEIVGTLDYMAPELLRLFNEGVGKRITTTTTAKADIFALGCIYYFVLSNGQHLFGKLLFERFNNIVSNNPQWQNLALNECFQELITKMTSYNPTQRPTAEDILQSVCFSTYEFIHESLDMKHGSREFKLAGRGIPHLPLSTSIQPTEHQIQDDASKIMAYKISTKNSSRSYLSINTNVLIGRIARKHDLSESYVDAIKTHINATNEEGIILLHYAVKNESVDSLASLVDLGYDWRAKAKWGETVLHLAAANGNFEAIKYFVALGADVGAKAEVVEPFSYGQTPLHRAVFTKVHFLETFRTLLDCGADVNERDQDGNNVLLLAVKFKRSLSDLEEIVCLGGDWRVKDKDGSSVIHCALARGHTDAIKYFVELGRELNVWDNFGNTFLHTIAYFWDSSTAIQMLHILVENGVDINATDKHGRNVLNFAKSLNASSELIEEIMKLSGKYASTRFWDIRTRASEVFSNFSTWIMDN